MKRSSKVDSRSERHFRLGRDQFAKISAVEGIELTRDARKRLVQFDNEGLSSRERVRRIIAAYRKA
jgi:hypothetical protein